MTFEPFWWEVEYYDGTTISEISGARYRNIDRPELKHFRFRDTTGTIVELTAETDRTGWNLVWRRRLVRHGAGVKTVYVMGWVPQGPLVAVDPTEEKVYHALKFQEGDPVFYPPTQHYFEGERWPTGGITRVINSAAERTD